MIRTTAFGIIQFHLTNINLRHLLKWNKTLHLKSEQNLDRSIKHGHDAMTVKRVQLLRGFFSLDSLHGC